MAATASAQLPPSQDKDVDELIAEMQRHPLLTNSLDDVDPDNDILQALKALAYEGTRAEIALNFKEQGNEAVKAKHFPDGREFYTKALAALRGPRIPQESTGEPGEVKVVEIEDEEAEAVKEASLEEACLVNRALCNLEMSISA
jgi:hypothetical protein